MHSSTIRRTIAAAAAISAVALIAAPGAHAQSATTAAVAGGETQLQVFGPTAKVLAQNGVSVRALLPAKADGLTVTFPVSAPGSAVDPKTYAGRLNHNGGLSFKAGGKTLRLTNFRVDVGSTSSLSALPNRGARTKIISLNTGNVTITRSGINTGASGIVASLSQAGAQALNRFFGVSLFSKGLKLGTVRSEARFSEVVFASGKTDLALDAGTLTALTGLGVTPGIVAPATLVGTTASFPITGGKVDATTLAGSITHSGGISLTAGATSVALTDFDIRAPLLFLKVNGATPRGLIELNTANAKVAVSGRNVTVTNVVAKLNDEGASALSTAFGTSVPEVTLGSATVKGVAR